MLLQAEVERSMLCRPYLSGGGIEILRPPFEEIAQQMDISVNTISRDLRSLGKVEVGLNNDLI